MRRRGGTPGTPVACRAPWLKPGGEKECFERCSRSPVGFHMVAELPGAATVEAMSRPEQEETEEDLRKPEEKLRAKVS